MKSGSSSSSALLVDDDESVLRALKMLMRSIGWQSTEATNAKEALACLSGQSYDLVIADINMPGMSGIELCRSIQLTYGANAPICMILSGMVDAKTRAEAHLAGATVVMMKPVGRQEIVDEFKKHGLFVQS